MYDKKYFMWDNEIAVVRIANKKVYIIFYGKQIRVSWLWFNVVTRIILEVSKVWNQEKTNAAGEYFTLRISNSTETIFTVGYTILSLENIQRDMI